MTVSPVPQLRPLGMGQLLDQALRLYRRNFLKFVGIIAVVQIPLGLLQLGSSLLAFSGFAQLSNPTPGTRPEDIFGPGFVVGMIGTIIVAILSLVLLQVMVRNMH